MENLLLHERLIANRYLIAIIALLTIPLSGLSIDIYVPSLPAVSQFFQVDKNLVQLTIAFYLMGFGATQLFSGSIVDSLGRKKPFIISMIIYIATNLLIPYLQNIDELLWLRFFQGVAIAFLNVSMRAVISDLFKGRDLYKMVNYMTIVWALGPIIAPAVGGYLQFYFGWHAPFYFLASYAAIMLLLNFIFVPETAEHFHRFNLKEIFYRYREILTHIDFLAGLLGLGFMYSMLVLFGIVTPFLVQEALHYSAITFGHAALVVGFSWFLGNMTNRFFIAANFERKVIICLGAMIVIGLISLAFSALHVLSLYNVIVPICAILYFAGIVFPNFYARNISLFPKSPGTANALLGGFMILISAACTGFGTLLKSNTQIPLLLTYFIQALICLLVILGLNSVRRKG